MANKEEIQFVPGLFAKAPRETAPPFVKASISIKVAELGVWLRERHKAGEEWVNIDILESKKGSWYAKVNTFKPKEKEEAKTAGRFDDVDDDIPF
jgi:hypothetical protein